MYQIINYYQENNQKITDYKLESRFLWDDHVGYTRNAIISILSELPDVEIISQRLIKNQEDIGTFVSPYYSVETVQGYVDLLKNHIIIATDVIKGVEGAEDQWRINGNEIVNYMHSMNRIFWPAYVVGPMWSKHLDLTIDQVNARNNSMWNDDIKAYDENHIHMSEFSDLFSTGIIYQNMDMFCSYTTGV